MESLRGAVEAVLSRRFGVPVSLGSTEELRPDKAYRVHLDAPAAGLPTSVVAKKVRDAPEAAYDPDQGEAWNPAWRFFGEWAALAFLATLGEGDHAPRFLGGDRAAGVIVLEDLGRAQSMADVLMGDDRARAEAALVEHAAALGRLHAAAGGREADYQRSRDALGPRVVQRDAQAWRDLDAQWEPLLRGLELAGVAPAAGFAREYRALRDAVAVPGLFRSFAHCDPCADNCLLVGGGPRLIDFERAGYHHAPLDAVYARLSFPSCGIAGRVPAALVPGVEAAYRATLVHGCPAAADDRLFGRAIVQACAFWLVSNGNWLLGPALAADHTWGTATWRQRVVTRLEALAEAAATVGHLEALGETAGRTAARLRAVWPPEACALALFPAFG